MRIDPDQLEFCSWFGARTRLDFSSAIRVLLGRVERGEGLSQEERHDLVMWKREQRKIAEMERPTPIKDPTHCCSCGKGDPWFTWYSDMEEGRCQGCGDKTYRDAVA